MVSFMAYAFLSGTPIPGAMRDTGDRSGRGVRPRVPRHRRASPRRPNGNVAALQVALRAANTYRGAIDGLSGPMTKRAVRRFQRRKRIAVDGMAGPQTRRALGRRGRPRLGARSMRRGNRGWDVAALQFGLRRRGFSSGSIDGGFGPATEAAVRRFQRARGLVGDGVAGPATLRSLRRGARRHGRRSRGQRPPGPGGVPAAAERPDQQPLRDALGPDAPGRGLRRRRRRPCGRRGTRHCELRRVEHRRVRQPRGDRPPAGLSDLVRPPLDRDLLARARR